MIINEISYIYLFLMTISSSFQFGFFVLQNTEGVFNNGCAMLSLRAPCPLIFYQKKNVNR